MEPRFSAPLFNLHYGNTNIRSLPVHCKASHTARNINERQIKNDSSSHMDRISRVPASDQACISLRSTISRRIS